MYEIAPPPPFFQFQYDCVVNKWVKIEKQNIYKDRKTFLNFATITKWMVFISDSKQKTKNTRLVSTKKYFNISHIILQNYIKNPSTLHTSKHSYSHAVYKIVQSYIKVS